MYIQDTHAHKLVLYISFVEVHTHTDIESIGLGQSLIDTSGRVHRSGLYRSINHTTLAPPTILTRSCKKGISGRRCANKKAAATPEKSADAAAALTTPNA